MVQRTCGPLSVLPLWGEKPIFGPVSKNNTGMAALRAGLPVKMCYTLMCEMCFTSNYRLISLLTIFTKLLEKLMHKSF